MQNLLKLMKIPPYQLVSPIDCIASMEIAVAALVIAEILLDQLGESLENGHTQGTIAWTAVPYGIVAFSSCKDKCYPQRWTGQSLNQVAWCMAG
jgi:hypothetical protein